MDNIAKQFARSVKKTLREIKAGMGLKAKHRRRKGTKSARLRKSLTSKTARALRKHMGR